MGKVTWKLSKGLLVVVKGKMCCLLYKTHLKIYESQLNEVENDASLKVWHKHMAYKSEKGLQLLIKGPFVLTKSIFCRKILFDYMKVI